MTPKVTYIIKISLALSEEQLDYSACPATKIPHQDNRKSGVFMSRLKQRTNDSFSQVISSNMTNTALIQYCVAQARLYTAT